MRPEIRIAAFYALTFGVFGVSLPYWPLWLQARGLSPDQIGLVFAASMLGKIVAIPTVAALADRLDRRRAVILSLLLASLGATGLYLPAHGAGPIIALAFVTAACITPVMALTDTLAVTMAHGGRFDYGRVRLFGSLGFMLVALGTGEAIAGRPADLILWLMLFLLALACLGAVALPEGRAAEGGTRRPALRAQLSGTMALLKQPGLRWFLLATGLIQNSHVAYYAFGTIYWQKAGIGAATIGWLWAEGVLAEIALFAAAPFITARLGAAQLIMLGGIGGAVRWLALGLSTDLAVLVPMQLLHALSFAAAHLGAMRYLARAAPPGLSATAQGLYGALPLGIGSGIFYVATGILIEHYGGGIAFVAMAASAFAGMAVMSYSDTKFCQNYRYMRNSG